MKRPRHSSNLDSSNLASFAPDASAGYEASKANDGVQTFSREQILEFLDSIYFAERVLSQKMTVDPDNRCHVELVFPPYDKICCEGEHVSASQISEAMIEAKYLTLALSIQQGNFPIAVPEDWFNRCAPHILYFRNSVTFRRMLNIGETYLLTTELVSISERRLRKRFLSLVFKQSGFIDSESEWLLEFQYVPQISYQS